ncbi:MAG: [FeFe] hydrogenase H-cluster maturation GTPase HydF [Lachnospiraceae bacterium]|nr:[FeFe] hydrogenase H-cluster maturation GTPase HydF [Lachnospiraceae bacterium]
MSMNSTPKGERIHIALFGRRNAGKSSLINAITGQDLAIVSEVKGTTTDPVYKAMEILPLGPVMLIDTPGLDDEGALGEERIKKARSVLNKTDIALIVADGAQAAEDFSFEQTILELTQKKEIPVIVVMNKQDQWTEHETDIAPLGDICVSSLTGYHIHELKEMISRKIPAEDQTGKLVGDLLSPGDFVVLVVPIDSAAPKGRLILPQQQVIRDVLEAGATAVVCRDTELSDTLARLGQKPRLVVTDSQAFASVSKDTPEDIPLTSFSILFSRYKGDLEVQLRGVDALEHLKDGDILLMAEGCTHHRQCDDIGTVKLPRWIREYTKKELVFETSSGGGFPEDLSRYAMIVHCGGCTLSQKEMAFRIAEAKDQQVPIVNYGTLIAQLKGVLKRSVEPFSS